MPPISLRHMTLYERYLDLKGQHPETILFFRLGDFYEAFGDDARIVSRELQVVLTSRPMGPGIRVPMAGLPFHSLDGGLARLIARGHRVAVAEQITDAEGDAAHRARDAHADVASVEEEPRQLSLPLD